MGHLAAQCLRHGLEPVADAHDRHAGLEQLGVHERGARRVHGGGAAGQDDGRRVLGEHLLDRERVRHDLRVHLRLAHPARDELGVLRAEVDDDDRAGGLGLALWLA
jgi:hypothetical protein